jgi:hypothetical protein
MRPSHLTAPILALCAALSLVACDEPDDTPDNDAPDSGALDMGGDQSVAPDMMADDIAPDLEEPADMAPDQADAPDMDAPDIAPDMMTVEGCDEAGAPFGGGDGSAAAPFLICTPAQLSAIREMNTPASYKLASDIALGQFPWTPIPTMFGELDGGGHTIFNLRYTTTDPQAQGTGGLINNLYGAGIHDLSLERLEVSAPGAVAGLVYSVTNTDGPPALRNIRVKLAKIVATHAESRQVSAAGVVGSINGVLEDIDVDATIEATGMEPLLTRHSAMIASNMSGQARRLSAEGTMTLGIVREAGGLVGQLGTDATLTDSSVMITLITGGPNNGGLVGLMQPGARLERCAVAGTLTGRGIYATELGGAVGKAEGFKQGQVTKRAGINRVTVNGQVNATSVGGLVGNLAGGALTNARFEGLVQSSANKGVVPGAGCMVASFARVANQTGIPGQAGYVVALCGASQQGSFTEPGVGGVTGDHSALIPEDVSELRWDSVRTSPSGFTNTDPSVRGMPEAMLKDSDQYSGWPPDAWSIVPGQLPTVRLDPPMP